MRARNEGSVTKRIRKRRDGTEYIRYQAVISLGTGPDGKRNRPNGPLRKTRAEALADLKALRAQGDLGIAPDTERLSDYLLAWVEGRNIKKRTRDTYKADIKNHIIPSIGNVRLCDLTPAHVNHMIGTITNKSSASVARKARSVLHNALERARLEERIVRNPVAVTEAPATPRADLRRWEPQDAYRFVQAAKRFEHGPLFLLVLGTGMRIGEALGLMWHDLEGDTLTVRRALRTVGKPVLDTPKTKRSIRRIRLGADVHGMLVAHRQTLQERGLLELREFEMEDGLDKVKVHGALMFPHESGGPMRLDVIRKDYKLMLAAAKVPEIRIHDLRHYHLSRLINMGIDPAMVSKRAGHSRTSTTFDFYVDVFESQMEGLAVSFDDLGEKPKEDSGGTADGTTDVRPMDRAEQGEPGHGAG